MTALTVAMAMASAGWLVVCSACAQSASSGSAKSAMPAHDLDSDTTGRYAATDLRIPDPLVFIWASGQPGLDLRINAASGSMLFPIRETAAGRYPGNLDVIAAYRLSPAGNSSVFGYMGFPGEPALGPPVSYMRRYAGVDSPEGGLASHWLDSANGGSQVFTLGYRVRDLTLESSTFSGYAEEDLKPAGKTLSKLDSRSTRLSFNPSPNWAFQISRGSLSGLDLLVPNGDVRRTTISATYRHAFTDGNWETTLAWGRNARKLRETAMGYLLESTLRFNGTHAVFGRVEQVGSDELLREDESLQRQMFKMNKLTVGYFQNVEVAGPLKFDIGVLASRHFIPSAAMPSYGNNPASYMMFVRLKLQ